MNASAGRGDVQTWTSVGFKSSLGQKQTDTDQFKRNSYHEVGGVTCGPFAHFPVCLYRAGEDPVLSLCNLYDTLF